MSIFSDNENEGPAKEPDSKEGNILFSVPDSEEKALVCKLLKDPFSGESCVKFKYFKHMIGNSEKDTRYHVCRDSIGEGDSPENDFYWSLVEKLSQMKKDGISKESEEYKDVLATKKFFQPKNGGYLFFIEPNSSKIMALKVGAMVFNRLFGRKKTEWAAEVPSLVKEMQDKGLVPYLDKNPDLNKTGWVKIWKTGEKLATEYHMEIAKHEEMIKDPKGDYMITRWTQYQVADEINKIINGETPLDLKKCPNVLEFEKKGAWTLEESEAFVEAEGALEGTPERLFDNDDETSDKKENVKDDNPATDDVIRSTPPAKAEIAGPPEGDNAQPVSVSLDDIPF